MNWFWSKRHDESSGSISQISVQELKEKIDEDDSLLLIDVRTREEYEDLRVPHIKARIEFHEIAEKIDPERFPKDQPIYLICRAGRRSLVAARELREIGYQKLINISGGTSAWLKANFPVIKR